MPGSSAQALQQRRRRVQGLGVLSNRLPLCLVVVGQLVLRGLVDAWFGEFERFVEHPLDIGKHPLYVLTRVPVDSHGRTRLDFA